MPILSHMREDYRAVTRLPVLTQFLLAPLSALITGIAFAAWQWTKTESGVQTQGYHELGWTLLPLAGVAYALFLMTIERAVKRKNSERLLAVTLLTVAALIVGAYARSAALSA